MISIKLPKKAQAILQKMAQESGHTENEIAFEALMERIEDWYDAQIIAERMKDDDGVTIPLEDLCGNLTPRTCPKITLPNDVDHRVHLKSQERTSEGADQ